MDFQSMLKKVKQRQYKSKKEFKDDLDLIWSNCFLYNATEVCHSSTPSTPVIVTPMPRTTPSVSALRASRPRLNTSSNTLQIGRSVPILAFPSTSLSQCPVVALSLIHLPS
jgi:hypothetical protein